MNDTEFMELDEELYKAIQNVVTKFSGIKEFELNADSDTFNAYCDLRNIIVLQHYKRGGER
tara:strand:+ start:832 stop:1014 length:183 start_codon:yes stop_codon:yes gene_type:complete